MGVIFGQVIGDALGLGTTRLSRDEVRQIYPNGLYHYADIAQYRPDLQLPMQGMWSESSEQMLIMLDILLQYRAVRLLDMGRGLYQWAQQAANLDATTRAVLKISGYINDPQTTARFVWERSKHSWAGNAGLVRTAFLGVWDFEDPIAVQYHAAEVCKLTHFDPRCVGSTVMMALIISGLAAGTESERALVNTAYEIASQFDERMLDYVERALEGEVQALALDEGLDLEETDQASNYTLKAMGAGLWALIHAPSFEEGVLTVLHQGGDAHNNGAIVGAVLGAKFGFKAISADWINGLANYHDLYSRIEHLVAACEQL